MQSSGWPWGVAVVFVALAAAGLWRRGRHDAERVAQPPQELPAPSVDEGPRLPGDLDQERITLPQPPGYVTLEDCGRFENRWTFHRTGPDALRAMFHAGGMTASQESAMVSAARCAGDTCVVTPPLDALESLSPTTRDAVHRALAASTDNLIASAPYRWPAEMEPWSAASALSPRARALLEHTTWVRGDERMFIDIPLACQALGTDAERLTLLEVIKRRLGVRAWVRVPAAAPVDALARYWATTPADVAPLRARFEAARSGRVAVRELLSPMARQRVDTFPALRDPGYDCFWTALHFFDPSPRAEFGGASGFVATLASSYARVEAGDERLGDVVALYGVNDEPIHACNHVAPGIVFSKDGASPRRPWMLQRFDDVRRSYPAAVTVRVWRRR